MRSEIRIRYTSPDRDYFAPTALERFCERYSFLAAIGLAMAFGIILAVAALQVIGRL